VSVVDYRSDQIFLYWDEFPGEDKEAEKEK
jgi:hypothetical protein